MTFKPIAIIPHYNHATTIEAVAEKLVTLGFTVLIIDDGSTPQHQAVLHQLATRGQIQVIFRQSNGGKGAAVKTGLKAAFKAGYSHALQVDADGQHQLEDSLKIAAASQANPQAIICGAPLYDDNAPKARRYGRKITDFWIAIHTLSLDIKDGMCGFRLYPLKETLAILEQENIGDRMDFDIEILVHCHWYKIPFIWIDTPVKYNIGGISHFRALADNLLISKMHARLFFNMLGRLFTGKMR